MSFPTSAPAPEDIPSVNGWNTATSYANTIKEAATALRTLAQGGTLTQGLLVTAVKGTRANFDLLVVSANVSGVQVYARIALNNQTFSLAGAVTALQALMVATYTAAKALAALNITSATIETDGSVTAPEGIPMYTVPQCADLITSLDNLIGGLG